ncbi:MAG: hypothetical protein V7K72_16255, partial [Nostoc sp.]|uniref:hypothetical protein n=1 Tax=Nostoc sp. TaxID=1180 RepID=UPI002FFA6A3E
LCDFNLKRAAHGYFNLSSLFFLLYAASYKIGIRVVQLAVLPYFGKSPILRSPTHPIPACRFY